MASPPAAVISRDHLFGRARVAAVARQAAAGIVDDDLGPAAASSRA